LARKWLQAEGEQWLPAYAGGKVRGLRRLLISAWLANDPAARERLRQIEGVRHEIRRQPQERPSAEVLLRLQATIAEEATPVMAPTRPIAAWAIAIITALAALLLVWQALPPGISLEWSVQGETPQAFRVYRAPAAADSPVPSRSFTLLDELPADEAAAAYQFTDWLPVPGQEYVYRVEALDQAGLPTASQTVVGRGLDALAGQVLTLAALTLLFISVALIVRSNRRSHPVYFQTV
jgi:hypothetical protein